MRTRNLPFAVAGVVALAGVARAGSDSTSDPTLSAGSPAIRSSDEPMVLHQIIVLGLEQADVPDNLTKSIEEVLLNALRRAKSDTQILGQSELRAMLTLDEQRMATGCTDTSCLAEIGGALGADHIIVGSLGRVGELYLLGLKLVNTNTATVISSISDRTPGPVDRLVAITEAAAYKLLGQRPPDTIIQALHAPNPGAAEDPAFYQTWWFWTVAGVVVAGGAAAGIVAATTGGSPPEGLASGNVNVSITP